MLNCKQRRPLAPLQGQWSVKNPGPTLRDDSEASSEATFSCRSLGTLVLAMWSALPRLAVGSRSTGLGPKRSSEYSASTGVPVFPATRACYAMPCAVKLQISISYYSSPFCVDTVTVNV